MMKNADRAGNRNQTFQYLEALIMIMVIDDHTGTTIGILSGIFPYNSFYMPLLVFISGYFYKRKSTVEHLIHKSKRLLIPYLIWNLAGNGLAYIFKRLGIVNWYCSMSLQSLKYCLISGPLSSVNGPSWFVIMLFYVSVTYNMTRNILRKEGRVTDSVLLAGYITAGCGALVLCMQGYNRGIYLPVLRMLFYLQFYHLGYFFHQYLEGYVKKLSAVKTCLFCICVNVILICIYGKKINFIATSGMGNFNSWYLPLITSVTGILFWYKVMDYLSEKIGQNRLIDLIAHNSFTVMETHLLFTNLPNFYILFSVISGRGNYPDFDIQKFKGSAWFRYNDNAKLIGFFCGLIGSLAAAYMMKKAKNIFLARRENGRE